MAIHNTPIILAADQEDANSFWEIAGAGPNQLTAGLVPLSGPADAEPTHFFASAQFERYFETAYAQFQLNFPNTVFLRFDGNTTGNVSYVNAELVAMNLQRYNPLA